MGGRSAVEAAAGGEFCCCCDDDIYDDFFSSFCCGCCVVAQLDRAEFGWAANQLSGCQESFAEPGDLEAPAA